MTSSIFLHSTAVVYIHQGPSRWGDIMFGFFYSKKFWFVQRFNSPGPWDSPAQVFCIFFLIRKFYISLPSTLLFLAFYYSSTHYTALNNHVIKNVNGKHVFFCSLYQIRQIILQETRLDRCRKNIVGIVTCLSTLFALLVLFILCANWFQLTLCNTFQTSQYLALETKKIFSVILFSLI